MLHYKQFFITLLVLMALAAFTGPAFACDQCSGGEPVIVTGLDLADVPVVALQNDIEVTHLYLATATPDRATAAATVEYCVACTETEQRARHVGGGTKAMASATSLKSDFKLGTLATYLTPGVLRHGGQV